MGQFPTKLVSIWFFSVVESGVFISTPDDLFYLMLNTMPLWSEQVMLTSTRHPSSSSIKSAEQTARSTWLLNVLPDGLKRRRSAAVEQLQIPFL